MSHIPVYTQLSRARPVIQQMIRTRQQQGAVGDEGGGGEGGEGGEGATELDSPIAVEYLPRSREPPFPFDAAPPPASSALAKHPPDAVEALRPVYARCATHRLQVDFSQCTQEDPALVWMPTQRDMRFQTELERLVRSLEQRATALFEQLTHRQPAAAAAAAAAAAVADPAVLAECVALYKRNYTRVYLYRTRNTKASETLDKKYEKMCYRVWQRDGVHVQLFNLRRLMYDVTQHAIVPRHERLHAHYHRAEIDAVKRQYHICEDDAFPLIAQSDPVAAFVGLQIGDLCKITRRNRTSGEFVVYRECVRDLPA